MIPVIVTTLEALQDCVEDQIPLIYVDNSLLRKKQHTIYSLMDAYTYTLVDKTFKAGVLFSRSVDRKPSGICDPLNIL